jgi:casein kinase 1
MDRYRFTGQIGDGSYGKVLKGIDTLTNEKIAAKVETGDDFSLIEREAKIYESIWKRTDMHEAGIPKILWHGMFNKKRVLIMSRLGPSLDVLYDRSHQNWKETTLWWIAAEGLSRIQEIHNSGIIHRDIKPDNFSIGYRIPSKLYVFDFGLSYQYTTDNQEHVAFKDGFELIGTLRYASVNNHKGIQQTRRDDLESFLYMMLYLWKGTLPWQGINTKNKKEKSKIILEHKIKYAEDFAKDIHVLLFEFYRYVKSLGFSKKPDYREWIEKFRDQLKGGVILEWAVQTRKVHSVRKTLKKKRK